MAVTKVDLDRQAKAKTFQFGSSSAGEEASVTIEKGTQATSQVVLDVKASVNVGGDLNLSGDLNITGSVNAESVTNLEVQDKTITLNSGGTTAGASNSAGLLVEGDSVTVVGAIKYDSTTTSKFTIGNGTTQREIADISSSQTFTNKSLTSPSLTGTPTAPTATAGTNTTQLATTAFVAAALAALNTGYHHATTISGTQDGTNKNFTIGNALSSGSEQIFLNGQLLMPGSSNDYTISGTSLTFASGFTAPAATDVIRVYGVY